VDLGHIRFRFRPRVTAAIAKGLTVLPFFIFLGRTILFLAILDILELLYDLLFSSF